MIPIARSPITPLPPVTLERGWEVSARRSAAALKLADCSPLSKVLVRSDVPHLFKVPNGRAARDAHGTLVVGSCPGEWLLLSPPSTGASVARRVEPSSADGLVTVIDDTHGRALLRMTGAKAAGVLEKICAIDLADRSTPNGSAFRTSIARLVADVVRDDGGTPSYLIGCERSSGQYLFDTVLDAGDEFGIEVDGFVSPGI